MTQHPDASAPPHAPDQPLDPAGPPTQGAPAGERGRRGPFQAGERVQLTDSRGRMHTITLAPGASFDTHRGRLHHDDLIGLPDGSTVRNTVGEQLLALRPLLSDYVMSMPRGAAVVYPKDAGQIVQYADIFPGATVVEAGVGSGALSMSLLRAVGEHGRLHSFERRPDFAEIAKGNARQFFGADHPAWTVTVGDLVDVLPQTCAAGTVDRVVLDMLAPWECLEVVADALTPGGLLICYVATATQLSRVAEGCKEHGGFTEPHAWETIERDWHLEGLAVRPVHRMHGHTGFLITTRRLAPGVTAPLRKRRPAKGPEDPDEQPFGVERDHEWTPEEVGERVVSDKRLRRVRRSVTGEAPPPDMAPKPRDEHGRVIPDPQDEQGQEPRDEL